MLEEKCCTCGHWGSVEEAKDGCCGYIVFEPKASHPTNYAETTDPGGLATGAEFGCTLHEPCKGCARDQMIAAGIHIYPYMGEHPEHTCPRERGKEF
jgi:hypothetical protein